MSVIVTPGKQGLSESCGLPVGLEYSGSGFSIVRMPQPLGWGKFWSSEFLPACSDLVSEPYGRVSRWMKKGPAILGKIWLFWLTFCIVKTLGPHFRPLYVHNIKISHHIWNSQTNTNHLLCY